MYIYFWPKHPYDLCYFCQEETQKAGAHVCWCVQSLVTLEQGGSISLSNLQAQLESLLESVITFNPPGKSSSSSLSSSTWPTNPTLFFFITLIVPLIFFPLQRLIWRRDTWRSAVCSAKLLLCWMELVSQQARRLLLMLLPGWTGRGGASLSCLSSQLAPAVLRQCGIWRGSWRRASQHTSTTVTKVTENGIWFLGAFHCLLLQ